MKKEIRFSSTIDTKEFDRAVESMQRKLQQVYQRSDQSRQQLETRQMVSQAGLGPKPTVQEKVRADQDDRRLRREMDKFIKDQVREQEKLTQIIAKQVEERKKLSKLAKEDYESAVKLVGLQKSIATNKEKQRMTDESIRQAIQQRQQVPGFGGEGGFAGVLERGVAAYRGAGVGGAKMGGRIAAAGQGIGRGMAEFKAANPLAFYGTAAMAVSSGLGLVGEVADVYAQAPRRVLAGQGQATRALTSPLIQALSRGALEQSVWGPERAKAIKMAEEEIKAQKKADLWKLGAAAIGLVGGAMLSATGAGAAVGVPMMAAATAFGSGTYLALQGAKRQTGVYESELEAQRAEAIEQSFQSLKNLNPLKEAAFERYQQESMANLPFQRATGLTDEQMMAQLGAGATAGFTTDITRQAMGGILGAGGSTRAARGMATTANLLERNLGLTNAAQAIGRISALTGDQQMTEAALTKVLSEAFSLGLDDSEFREEQRRFVDNATEIITRTGATTPEAMQALTSRMGEFVTGPGIAQVEAAKTAAGLVSQITATTQGPRGAIQASIMNRDPRFAELNIDERNALLSLSEDEILAGEKEGDPLVAGLLAKTGMSAKELIKTVKRPALTTRADIDKKIEQLKESKEGSLEQTKLKSEVLAGMGYDTSEVLHLKPAEKEALLKGVMGKELTPEEQKLRETAETRLKEAKEKAPETAADKSIETQAASDQAMMKLFETFKTDFDEASVGAKKLATAAEEAAKTIQEAYSAKNFDPTKVQAAIDNLVKILNIAAPQAQPRGAALLEEKAAPGGRGGQ